MSEASDSAISICIAFSVILGVLVWLLRALICRTQLEAEGRAVLITGCDTGIGHEVARHLDSLGCLVFAGCQNTASEGAQRLRVEASPRLQLVNMDVTQPSHVEMAIRYIEESLPQHCSGLWAVINNAGSCVCGEYDWQTMDQVRTQVETNIMGSLTVTKACLPLLKHCPGSRLINVTSVASRQPCPGLSVYTATKHALAGFSEVLRLELAKFQVSVVTVQPGDFSKATNLLNDHHRNMNLMWSEMTDTAREEYKAFFLAYHDTVAASGFTGRRIKPLSVLPPALLRGFETAVLAKVPQTNYTVMPSLVSSVRLAVMDLVPKSWIQSYILRRYSKSIPEVSVQRESYNKSNVNL